MRYYKIIDNGYLVAVGNGSGGEEITEDEYNNLREVIRNKPKAESGFDYRLKADLTRELYELPIVEETSTPYTAEQLNSMSNIELQAILADLGISKSMTKENMVRLILDEQNT